jgi:hypothetical protein
VLVPPPFSGLSAASPSSTWLPWLTKISKSLAAVAILTYVQLKFPHSWLASLGLSRLERASKKLASHKPLSVFIVGLSLFLIRGVCALITGVPLPRYHDEFSYLLAADTFAHGRLANPPHPMWMHFETYHVIWHPTYMSMYPPGEGLILALGQLLGNPWIGQLIAASLMCAAICWMLQAWIPPSWALLGGVLAVARLGILSYWTNGYWCACLPAFGGALVLGALLRIQRHQHRRDAAIMAVGLFILANTRPYEGFILSLAVAIALFVWMLGKRRPPTRITLARIVAPLLLTLTPLAVWTGYYYFRVTGSPLRMAYELNRSTYSMARYFIWQAPWPQKNYNNPTMAAYYQRELHEDEENRTLRGFLHRTRIKIYYFFLDLLVLPLPFVFIALPCAARDRRMRVPWTILGFFILGLAVETWFLPHYFAPAIALLYLIIMQCMRHLRWFHWRNRPVGLAFVRAIAVVYVATVVLRILLAVAHIHPEKEFQHGDLDRESIVQRLDALPGQHVVLVSYTQGFDLDREWVYNASDIDASRIVWARDLGETRNQELLSYYRGRHFWQVAGDYSPPQLEPYAGQPYQTPARRFKN